MESVKFTLLRGTLVEANPLSLLRGNGLVWQEIFRLVDAWYEEHIDRDSVAFDMVELPADRIRSKWLASTVEFPKPHGIQINMMPIRIWRLETLPGYCRQYAPLIEKCIDVTLPYDPDRVAYLTIHESIVPVGRSQRRQGLHIEQPGVIHGGSVKTLKRHEYFWGRGFKQEGQNTRTDGIYMASNVTDSCTVWPILIKNPQEVTDRHGGIEHMRERLGLGRPLEAGELCWFTDRTPHEATPLNPPPDDPTATFRERSFFRLVVGRISVWYSKHNTPNPLGVLPDAPISDEDKFS